MSCGLQYGFWRGYWNALGLQLGYQAATLLKLLRARQLRQAGGDLEARDP